MPTTLTLKNIPDDVYDRLKLSAEAHRRSMNSEAIVCLETVLLPAAVGPAERLARARQLRATLPQGTPACHKRSRPRQPGCERAHAPAAPAAPRAPPGRQRARPVWCA